MNMNMIKRHILLAAAFAAITTAAFAQEDYHLSQFQSAPLYLNPALTGMYMKQKGDYRVSSDYRSQWRALGTKPYTTIYLGYDMPLRKYDGKWGVGGYIINNRSGAGHFSTMNIMGSGAYNIIDGSDDHYLTTGLQMGLLYKTYDASTYTYDIQYDNSTGTFDQTIPNQETGLSKTSVVKFDANIGVFYKYMGEGKKYHPSAGFSIYHLTKPNESFTSYKSKLPMHFVFHSECDFDLKDNFILQPHFLYMNQAKAYEANIGVLAFYKINNSSLEILAGADYRYKDAIVAHIGFRQEQHIFRFSYDINTSGLNDYTGGRGAWEFSLILTGKRDQPLFKPLF
jgi:type IX secretion system PorP/SprF family membrane protein